jgi:hypothetical protein
VRRERWKQSESSNHGGAAGRVYLAGQHRYRDYGRYGNFVSLFCKNKYSPELLHSDVRLEGLETEQTITRRNDSVFSFHTHKPQNSSKSLKYSSPVFSSEQRVSKGEHTYGWSSASEGRCKTIKIRLKVLQRLAF